MIDGIKLVQNENGEFEEYDDTYDVVIHCESAKSNKHLERQAVDFCKREIAGVRSACSSSTAGTISRRCDIRGGRAG